METILYTFQLPSMVTWVFLVKDSPEAEINTWLTYKIIKSLLWLAQKAHFQLFKAKQVLIF